MKNLRFDVSFMCTVSCTGGSLKYFRTHRTGDCKQEDCLHYWTESEICSAKRTDRSLQEVSHCTRQKSSGRDIFAMVVTK